MAVIILALLSVDASAVTVIGSAGTLGANGVVTLPPSGASSYGWVSTWGGVANVGLSYIDIDQPSQGGIQYFNGSLVRSDVFSATAGAVLNFDFNYITSDGADIADYAWARLLDTSLNEVALLFTARNDPSGSFIPGSSMPAAAATLSPGSMPVISGPPLWSPLGGSSGACFRVGCGYTGWGQANFSLVASGSYVLEFGVTNWNDTNYDSGLAFSNVTISGNPIFAATAVEIGPGGGPGPTDPGSTTGTGSGTGTGTGTGTGASGLTPVPVPTALWLFGSSLVGLAAIRRRHRAMT